MPWIDSAPFLKNGAKGTQNCTRLLRLWFPQMKKSTLSVLLGTSHFLCERNVTHCPRFSILRGKLQGAGGGGGRAFGDLFCRFCVSDSNDETSLAFNKHSTISVREAQIGILPFPANLCLTHWGSSGYVSFYFQIEVFQGLH